MNCPTGDVDGDGVINSEDIAPLDSCIPSAPPFSQNVIGKWSWDTFGASGIVELFEDGTYEDTDAGTGAINYDDSQSGWYAQSVYKFHPQWRVGARYSQLYAGDVPAGLVGSALDDGGHDPWAATAMVDWTNSEFSRIRAQYSREEVASNLKDDQFTLQYIMSIGAHGAHKY